MEENVVEQKRERCLAMLTNIIIKQVMSYQFEILLSFDRLTLKKGLIKDRYSCSLV